MVGILSVETGYQLIGLPKTPGFGHPVPIEEYTNFLQRERVRLACLSLFWLGVLADPELNTNRRGRLSHHNNRAPRTTTRPSSGGRHLWGKEARDVCITFTRAQASSRCTKVTTFSDIGRVTERALTSSLVCTGI